MKTIGTSIYIEKARRDRIVEAAKILTISETELLSLLLQQSRKLFTNKAVCFKTVRYQRNCESGDYKISHIKLFASDYEIATSRRYVFKISVSFLFRLSVDLFLNKIIDDRLNNRQDTYSKNTSHRTNYYFKHFSIDRYCSSLAEFWVIPWPRE